MPALSGINGGGLDIKGLDIRTRLFLALIFSTGVILIDTWEALGWLAGISLAYALAHGRLKVIALAHGGVLLLSMVALFSVQILLIFMPGLGDQGMGPFVNPFLRVMILVNVLLALALSSPTHELMATLRGLCLPFFIYLPVTVMVRFIPGFIHDIAQIRESILIKGYRLNFIFVTFHPLLFLRLIFVPVVIRTLRTADELAVAAELKGIRQGRGPRGLGNKRLGKMDYLVGGLALVLIGFGIVQGRGLP